ncbi:MAG TPA: hypothetical protein VGB73_04835 [Pyrinomonadaceae bacterium]|jgi:hypothetical protein
MPNLDQEETIIVNSGFAAVRMFVGSAFTDSHAEDARRFISYVSADIIEKVPVGSTFAFSSQPSATFVHKVDREGRHYIVPYPTSANATVTYLCVENMSDYSKIVNSVGDAWRMLRNPRDTADKWFNDQTKNLFE